MADTSSDTMSRGVAATFREAGRLSAAAETVLAVRPMRSTAMHTVVSRWRR
ncbi:hypothetical protein LCGC14_0942360 [marine sediment metagenome]|uniref:Uncharacterized protein n=1 Tax=marine sediment metagenome TaxID=412755 RepID=A0A0F9P5W6_9ZZZZ